VSQEKQQSRYNLDNREHQISTTMKMIVLIAPLESTPPQREQNHASVARQPPAKERLSASAATQVVLRMMVPPTVAQIATLENLVQTKMQILATIAQKDTTIL
jgi:hypothetical protein